MVRKEWISGELDFEEDEPYIFATDIHGNLGGGLDALIGLKCDYFENNGKSLKFVFGGDYFNSKARSRILEDPLVAGIHVNELKTSDDVIEYVKDSDLEIIKKLNNIGGVYLEGNHENFVISTYKKILKEIDQEVKEEQKDSFQELNALKERIKDEFLGEYLSNKNITMSEVAKRHQEEIVRLSSLINLPANQRFDDKLNRRLQSIKSVMEGLITDIHAIPAEGHTEMQTRLFSYGRSQELVDIFKDGIYTHEEITEFKKNEALFHLAEVYNLLGDVEFRKSYTELLDYGKGGEFNPITCRVLRDDSNKVFFTHARLELENGEIKDADLTEYHPKRKYSMSKRPKTEVIEKYKTLSDELREMDEKGYSVVMGHIHRTFDCSQKVANQLILEGEEEVFPGQYTVSWPRKNQDDPISLAVIGGSLENTPGYSIKCQNPSNGVSLCRIIKNQDIDADTDEFEISQY